MRPLVLASNMLNEVDEVEEWYFNMIDLPLEGIVIVDGGSTDGTIEFFKERQENSPIPIIVVVDNIIQREGYGPSRNHLRQVARENFPQALWLLYLDADERIAPEDYHQLRFLKDYLRDDYDVLALPRIDWCDREKTKMAKDWYTHPDWQARMTRLDTNVHYIRRLHEQITEYKGVHADLTNPKIHHFHRSVPQHKRDYVGKVCAHLHSIDEMGDTYPEHHKEAHYRELLEKEGL